MADLEQVEASLKADEARVAAAQARLDDTVIRAAFDGRTGFRHVSVGSFVSPGTVITTLDDTSIIKLDFTVPETYLFVLRRGLPVDGRRHRSARPHVRRRRHEHGLARRLRDALDHRARRAPESGRPAAARHVHDRVAAGRGDADAARARRGARAGARPRVRVRRREQRRRAARGAHRQAPPRRRRDRRRRRRARARRRRRHAERARRQRRTRNARPAARADACGSRSSPSGGRSSRP